MYNGYFNEDSYLWDVVWANDRGLYEAFREYARSYPHQTPQTLGRNLKDAVSAALNGGGWGYSGVPDFLAKIPPSTWEGIRQMTHFNIRHVEETEFGEKVKETLGL